MVDDIPAIEFRDVLNTIRSLAEVYWTGESMERPSARQPRSDQIHGAVAVVRPSVPWSITRSYSDCGESDNSVSPPPVRVPPTPGTTLLGVMHLAGRAYDACFRDKPFAT